jgi:phosphoglycerol transferase
VRIDFLNQLPNHFNLKFSAQPFGPNVDQDLLVRLGSQQLHFKFQAGQLEYQLPIDLKGEKVTCIEFLPPKPTSPKQIGLSPDPRMLGVGLTYLRFKENDTL